MHSRVKYVVALSTHAMLSMASIAPAQTAQESLAELATHYQLVHSASLYAEALTKDGSHQAMDVTVSETGAYATLNFSDIYPALGLTWDERPHYFVYFDGQDLHVAYDSGASYDATRTELAYTQFPPPIHQFMVPWPVISAWADALASASDSVYEATTDGEFIARSDSLGLAIRWDDELRIRAVFRAIDFGTGNSNTGMEIVFGGYDTKPGRQSQPTTMRQVYRRDSPEDEMVHIEETKYAITRFVFNPADIDKRLLFDAKTLKVNHFDRATNNVYSPDGEFLFNKDDFLQSYLAANNPRKLKPWMIVVLVSLFLGSGYIAYRRFSPKFGSRA